MKITLLLTLTILILSGCQQQLQPIPVQRYQIVSSDNGKAWKIDTQTGETWVCASAEMATVTVGGLCHPVKNAIN